MPNDHFGTCSWTPESSFHSYTPYGPVELFGESGQRAVELMLLSAAACLNFYLVEYASARSLPVTGLEVTCSGVVVQGPERVSKIETRVTIAGDLDERQTSKMVAICERACKVMNTLKHTPETQVHIHRVAASGSNPPDTL